MGIIFMAETCAHARVQTTTRFMNLVHTSEIRHDKLLHNI